MPKGGHARSGAICNALMCFTFFANRLQRVDLVLAEKKVKEMWLFPKIGVPQNGWFIMENPIKMDDLGVPLFLETPMWRVHHLGKMLPVSWPSFEVLNRP